MTRTILSAEQHDRAVGAILGTVAAEILVVRGSTPNEWGDGTALSIPILQALAARLDLRDSAAQGRIVRRWIEWALEHPETPSLVSTDPGATLTCATTRLVLDALSSHDWEDRTDDSLATAALNAAKVEARRDNGHQAYIRRFDSGALVRSGALALGYLGQGEEDALADAARSLMALTHSGLRNGDMCVMWSACVRHAILTGQADITVGLDFLPEDRRPEWHIAIETVAGSDGETIPLMRGAAPKAVAAWAIVAKNQEQGGGFKNAIEAGLTAQGMFYKADTTVLAGTLAGAVYGLSALPGDWRSSHGWPDMLEDGLEKVAAEAVEAGLVGLKSAPVEEKEGDEIPPPPAGYDAAPSYH